jgi:hypothetical protein
LDLKRIRLLALGEIWFRLVAGGENLGLRGEMDPKSGGLNGE